MRALAQQVPSAGKQKSGSVLEFSETPSHYLIRFDMPEFLGDDVKVEVKQGELVVRGRDRWEDDEPKSVSVRLESDQPGVFARYHSGTLVVALPKASVEFPSLALSM